MKKILSIIILIFILLNINGSFAGDFQVETKLTSVKQESYKKQIDSIYKNFENKLLKLSEEKQILIIEKVIIRINKLLNTKLSDRNNFVLSYLNYLLKDKLNLITREVNLNLDDILKVDNNTTCDKVGFYFDNTTNSCQPINTIKPCNIENGTGIQKWRGDKWTECSVDKCNEGYINKDGIKCIGNASEEIECNIGNNWCKDNEEIKKDIISTSIRSCNIQNGVGEETVTFNNNIEQSSSGCKKIQCNDGYSIYGNICLPNPNNNTTKFCNIENGVGELISQTMYIQEGQQLIIQEGQQLTFQEICKVKSCNNGYKIEGNKCIKNEVSLNCNSNQHIEHNVCVSNIKQCNINGGKGEQIYSNGVWGNCILKSCDSGYILENNECYYMEPYFTKYKDNLGNNYINDKNGSNLKNIINPLGNINVNNQDSINIELGTIIKSGNNIICETKKILYKETGEKVELKSLGDCNGKYENSTDIFYTIGGAKIKKSYSKIEINISISKGKLSNMNQIYGSIVPTDTLKLTYIINDINFKSCINPLGGEILHGDKQIILKGKIESNNGIYIYDIYKTCNDGILVDESKGELKMEKCNIGFTLDDGICKKNPKFSFYKADLYGNSIGGASIIYDNISKLYWISNGKSINNYRGHNYMYFTWEEANNFCKNLNINGLGGWRLPTKEELQSIYIKDWNGFSLTNNNYFSFNNDPYYKKGYWSSSENKDYVYNGVWLVDNEGKAFGSHTYSTYSVGGNKPELINHFVRCVKN